MDVMIPSRAEVKREQVRKNSTQAETPSLGTLDGNLLRPHLNWKSNPLDAINETYDNKPYVWGDSLGDIDEYGAELGKEARVWRVYVKETDRWDEELVDGWNKSLDVILVFAALFSAVSTTFIIESSSQLRQDPNDTTAETLILISQTLLVIANGTQTPPVQVSVPKQDSISSFDPPRSAVIVNTLWYMSLSLSLATALLAMLAKDWCHSFKSNRTGHPWPQTIRRQRKWAMIEYWKMRELILVLPSLIHISLLLFSVGLSIYVWDLNDIVAIPVICISGSVLTFYILSSIAASLMQFFPYTTIMSRIWRSPPARYLVHRPIKAGIKGVWKWISLLQRLASTLVTRWSHLSRQIRGAGQRIGEILEYLKQALGYITWAALIRMPTWARYGYWPYWMISVIIRMLLFIPKYIVGTLFSFTPTSIFNRHTKSPSTEVQNQDRIISEALSWLIKNCETPNSVEIALQAIAGAGPRIPRLPLEECQASMKILQRLVSGTSHDGNTAAHLSLYARAYEFLRTPTQEGVTGRGKLEVLIWELQSENGSRVERLITESALKPSLHNLEALRIGSSAASQALQLLNKRTHSTKFFDPIIRIASHLLNGEHELHAAVLASLINTMALLSACSPNCFEQEVASGPYSAAYYSCMCLVTRYHPQGSTDMDYWTGSYLTICVLAQVGHSNQTSDDDPSYEGVSPRSKNSLLALINHYDNSPDVFPTVHLEFLTWIGFSEILSNPRDYGLENYDGVRELFVDLVPGMHDEASRRVESLYDSFPIYSRTYRYFDLNLANGRWGVSAYIRAIYQVYELTRRETPVESVYVFVIEMLCRVQCGAEQELCAKLMSSFAFPTMSGNLIRLLGKRRIGSLLFATLDDSSDSMPSQLAAAVLWLLCISYLRGDLLADDRSHLRMVLDDRSHLYDRNFSGEPAKLKTELEARILEGYFENRSHLSLFLSRVIECVLEDGDEFGGESLARTIEKDLKDVSPTLRGVSSFIREYSPTSAPREGDRAYESKQVQPRDHIAMEIMTPYAKLDIDA